MRLNTLIAPFKAPTTALLGWSVLIATVAAFAGGLWLGGAWHRGRAAITQNIELRQQIKQASKAIKQLQDAADKEHKHHARMAADYQAAAKRMTAIANKLEHQRDANHKHARQQRRELDALLRRRPDLDAELGDDVLQHWNRAHRAPTHSATPTTTGATGGSDATVPKTADGQRQPNQQPAGQPQRRGGDVSRLPEQASRTGQSRGRMVADRRPVVVQQPEQRRTAGVR